jgi:DNA repair protein RecN (Recombination protein N)
VASGGELSRLMLAVKSMISSSSLLPTIIFDEIDSGISGDVASKVGNILKKISEKMQVIVITHLPQIAGRSNEHFKVYKFIENEKTYSSIDRLNDDERIAELALMISGNPNLEAARETAKELLRNN